MLVEVTTPVALQPKATYYAKIQLTGAESAFGSASDVAAKLSGLFASVTVWDTSNVPAIFPDRTAYSSGSTYWARGVYAGAAKTVGLPEELKRVWVDAAAQPAPAPPGGYTPPPDFVGPPEPGWNWPIAPSVTPGPTPTPTPAAPGTTATASTASSSTLRVVAGVAAIVGLFVVTLKLARHGLLAAAAFAIVFLFSCAWDQPSPSAFTPVAGNPCGNLGVECGNHMCCDDGETCGQPNGMGCPAGACCDVRAPPAFAKLGDSGASENSGPVIVVTHPQRQVP
jgi:hypothetical protein